MRLATQGLFLFKDTLYKKIDGVTMGCPLGPTLVYGSYGKPTFMQ